MGVHGAHVRRNGPPIASLPFQWQATHFGSKHAGHNVSCPVRPDNRNFLGYVATKLGMSRYVRTLGIEPSISSSLPSSLTQMLESSLRRYRLRGVFRPRSNARHLDQPLCNGFVCFKRKESPVRTKLGILGLLPWSGETPAI